MTPFERWIVWAASVVTGATGIVLGWMKYFLSTADPWAVVNHPLQGLVLKLHIVSSPVLVFAIGLISLRHVWQHIRGRVPWGRRSGLTTAVTIAPMVLTGYLIQAITHTGWLLAMVIAHVTGGLLYLVGLAVHQMVVPKKVKLASRPSATNGAAGTHREGRARQDALPSV